VTKGALVELMPAFGLSMPNVIAFQFNPETLRHSWTQPQPRGGSNPLAVQGAPGETFSFSLAMDVTDQFALGPVDPQRTDAELNGIYSRISALEMLMFPVKSSPAPTGGGRRTMPAAQVPAVLFVWGDGRIVPVRVTSLTITEKLFDAALNPTHADAQIELRVLTPTELKWVGKLKDVVTAAAVYTQKKREAGAVFNLTTAARSFTLRPFPGS
jgi:hypothetical protein